MNANISSTDSLPFGTDDVVDAGVDDWIDVGIDDWVDDVGKDDWVDDVGMDDACVDDVAPIVPTCETNVGENIVPTEDNVVRDDDIYYQHILHHWYVCL